MDAWAGGRYLGNNRTAAACIVVGAHRSIQRHIYRWSRWHTIRGACHVSCATASSTMTTVIDSTVQGLLVKRHAIGSDFGCVRIDDGAGIVGGDRGVPQAWTAITDSLPRSVYCMRLRRQMRLHHASVSPTAATADTARTGADRAGVRPPAAGALARRLLTAQRAHRGGDALVHHDDVVLQRRPLCELPGALRAAVLPRAV